MLYRVLFLLYMTVLMVSADTNTTVGNPFLAGNSDKNASTLGHNQSNEKNSSIDQNSTGSVDHNSTKDQKVQSAMDLLVGYDSVTAAGVLKSEPDLPDENLSQKENNETNLIGPNTKLDDVTNLDIVKAQRKERKKVREKQKNAPLEQGPQLIDTIVVKGSVLQGQIDQLTSEYISFKLIYGEGSIRIDYSDVESLSTEHEYHIYFDGKETQGYITSIEDHAFLKVKHGEIEELITISKIDRFIISEDEDTSLENRLRNTFPYWRGTLDVGMEFESGNNIKNKLKVAGHVERTQTVHKTVFNILYAYEDTETFDTAKVLNKHELYTFLEQNYALTKSDFLFGEIGYDFDVPRGVDNRLYPSVGYGYRITGDKTRWIQFKVGLGFVYETFINDPAFDIPPDALKNQYAAGVFGVNAEYEVRDLDILNRILFGVTFFYMPGVQDLRDNWLLRYSATATIPLSESLSLKMVGRQVTDDNPSDEVGNNKLTFDLYLSLRF